MMLTPYPALEFICACSSWWWPELSGAALALAFAPILFGRLGQ